MLSVNYKSNVLMVTAKRSLVDSTLPTVAYRYQLSVGTKTHVFIKNTMEDRCSRFCSYVCGVFCFSTCPFFGSNL